MKIEIEYKPVQHRINVKGVPCQHVSVMRQNNAYGEFTKCLECGEDWN